MIYIKGLINGVSSYFVQWVHSYLLYKVCSVYAHNRDINVKPILSVQVVATVNSPGT